MFDLTLDGRGLANEYRNMSVCCLDSPSGPRWPGHGPPALPPWYSAVWAALAYSGYPCWTRISVTQARNNKSETYSTINSSISKWGLHITYCCLWNTHQTVFMKMSRLLGLKLMFLTNIFIIHSSGDHFTFHPKEKKRKAENAQIKKLKPAQTSCQVWFLFQYINWLLIGNSIS